VKDMNKDTTERIMIEFELNGDSVQCDARNDERLLDTLRDTFHLTGAKEGCAEGECGSCMVLVDNLPVNACLVPTYQVRGKHIETAESLHNEVSNDLLESGAVQCGACSPGVVVCTAWLCRHTELLEQYSIEELIAGNLCRCTGYDAIIEGIGLAVNSCKDRL